LPDVPTCDEAGIKGFDVADMLGLQGPAGMSPKVVARLQSAVAKVMREPAMAERMVTLGMDMQENGTASYAQFMKDDIDRYAKVIDRLGLKQKQGRGHNTTTTFQCQRTPHRSVGAEILVRPKPRLWLPVSGQLAKR